MTHEKNNPRPVLPPADETPVQMSPFSDERWDLDIQENLRRKEIQREYAYNYKKSAKVVTIPMETHVKEEKSELTTYEVEASNGPEQKDYFKYEPLPLKRPLSEIKFDSPSPPNLFPVLKFPEKRLRPDNFYNLGTNSTSFMPSAHSHSPNGIHTSVVQHYERDSSNVKINPDIGCSNKKPPYTKSLKTINSITRERNEDTKLTNGKKTTSVKISTDIHQTLSCNLQKEDSFKRKKKRGNPKTPEADKKVDNSYNENPQMNSTENSGTLKKYKSYDYLEKVSSQNTYRTTALKKVDDVFEQLKSSRQASDYNFIRGAYSVYDDRKRIRSILDNFAAGNLSISSAYSTWKGNARDYPDSKAVEKNLNHDSMKNPNSENQASRCCSLDGGSSKILQTGFYECNKPQQTLDKSAEINLSTSSMCHQSIPSPNLLTPLKKHFSKSQVTFRTTNSQWSARDQDESKSRTETHSILTTDKSKPHLESLINTSNPCISNSQYNSQILQTSTGLDKNLKICQCPHYHTEEGIKQVGLYSLDYRKKLFRLSTESEEGETEKGKKFEDKGVSVEVEEQKESSTSLQKVNRKTSKGAKVVGRSKPQIRGKSLLPRPEKKEKSKKKETEKSENNNSKVILWHGDNHVHILGQSLLRKNEPLPDSKLKDSTSVEKVKKPAVVKESKKNSSSVKILSEDKRKTMEARQEMLGELDLLEKLFAKLNSVEKLTRRRKVAQQKSWETSGTDKKSLLNETMSLLEDNNAEEEYQRRRRKLRSAILRHVRNWIKLDFTSG